ncbi:hypothetical protein JTE90_007010 [Oedothorax gibbosus]|uniref:No apical meristem-associated C-terminal domain-containing protein n=1 Tax=Oedothorax gibbosus TaxID=931172 RepID=A0AAV6TWJ8_9ARAC|nr:hypothetical protein JTE90_007010 [Oedothorax gibbosus]
MLAVPGTQLKDSGTNRNFGGHGWPRCPVPDCLNFSDSYDINKWDRSTEVETKWENETYPAYFIKFGENKRMMDDLIDQIVVSGDTSNLPLLQTENEGKRQKKRKRAEMAGPKMQKTNSSLHILTEVKEKIAAHKENRLEKAAEQLAPGDDVIRAELLMTKELYSQLQVKYAELKKNIKPRKENSKN